RELVVWSAAGRSLKWYLEAKARDQVVDVIAHSHGGAVLVYALLYGAVGIRNVITVSTPIRNDMIEHRAAATKRIRGRRLHFYCNEDRVQAEGVLGDGQVHGLPGSGDMLNLTRTWCAPALNVEIPGNGHSRCLNEEPRAFVDAGGVAFLLEGR